MIQKIAVSATALFLPFVAFAQGTDVPCSGNGKTLCTLINTIIGYANQLLVLMMGVAIVMFVYYVIKYYIKADSDRTEGNKYVMYSLIGFFVILSFWGLVNILQNSFGLQNDSNRPAGWQSYINIFPKGGGGGSGPAGTVGAD